MKRSSIFWGILLVLVGFATPLFSQSSWRLGFTGGLNNANQTWPEVGIFGMPISNSSRSGFLAGLTAEYRLQKSLFIHGEARYIQKGSKLGGQIITDEEGNVVAEGFAHYDFNYLELPILLKLQPGSGSIHPFLMIGSALGFKLSSRFTFTTTNIDTREDEELFSEDMNDVKSTELAFEIGGGAEIDINKKISLPVGVRYSRGITDTYGNLNSTGLLITIGTFFRL